MRRLDLEGQQSTVGLVMSCSDLSTNPLGASVPPLLDNHGYYSMFSFQLNLIYSYYN